MNKYIQTKIDKEAVSLFVLIIVIKLIYSVLVM